MKKNKYTKKGFTLLEIMIVIGIIAILGSFLLPKFVGYENKAKNVKVLSTAKQMYTAVMCAYSEKGNSMVESDVSDSISELTGEDVSGKVNKNGQNFDVTFKSDGKNYILSVDVNDGTYTVNPSVNTTS